MSAANNDGDTVAGIGAPHEPDSDPLRALAGIASAVLVLEAIVVLLVLTVIYRIDPERNFTPAKITYVLVIGLALVLAPALQRRPGAMAVNLGLQVATIAGLWVHWSMAAMGIVFLFVWLYVVYVGRVVRARLAAGLLPVQHD